MEKCMMADSELIRAYIDGNQDAFEQLVCRYKNQVYSFIFRTIRNQSLAEDLFQDTFVKVIRSIYAGKYQESGKFLPWVLRIAHNLMIDHFRKVKQMKLLPDQPNFQINSDMTEKSEEDRILESQNSNDLRELLQLLPVEQKEVVIMRYSIGMSFREIAEATGVSINTALGRMRYATINIRRMMAEKSIQIS